MSRHSPDTSQISGFSEHHFSHTAVRWRAPETWDVVDGGSWASDGWALGLCLHAVFHRGDAPVLAAEAEQPFDILLQRGVRWTPGATCPLGMYSLMLRLWHPQPWRRFDDW